MRVIILASLLLFSLHLCGQMNQTEYIEAKRQYSLGNYTTARQAFKSLIEDDVFGAYASFYYALCELQQGNQQQAYDMWRQIQLKYPEWNQQIEVNYWLGYVGFKQKKYWEAFRHIEALPEDLKEALIRNELADLSEEELKSAYTLNQDNQYIGSYLAKAILEKPYDERDHILLDELSEKLGFMVKPEEVNLPYVKKERYAAAVVLPFMFDSLANPQSVIRNSIIFNLYQGMLMAKEKLEMEGIYLDLFPFDTRKREDKARQLVVDEKLENADLIIGPLYSGPNNVISKYSKEKKITMVNPLSSNGAIIGDNPYSYLFKPSYSTQGRMAARYASQKFKENKKVFIFYETDRDSLIADAYRQRIQLDSFFVVRFERINNESAQQVQKDFIEQYEVRLDTGYSAEEIDSISLIPGRYVKTRPLRDEDDGTIIKDEEGEDVLEYYENRFTVMEDSIGHIFAATSSNLLANNFISLREVRSDSIGIIGYEEWLEFSLLSYDQLERLEVSFINPDFVDNASKGYHELKEAFINRIGREPDKYHVTGYELVLQLGKLLKEHGKYFQRGLIGGEIVPGILMGGMKYGSYNDNQFVPISRLKNLKLINQIKQQASSE